MPMIEVSENVLNEELKEMDEILENNSHAKKAHEEFEAECKLRKELANVRKQQNLTQKDVEEKTGLTQQMISRIEKEYEISPSIRNLIKYTNALGYELTLQPKKFIN